MRPGGAMLMTVPTAPLKTAPDPAPISAPPVMNRASDGECSQTASTARPIPLTIVAMPAASARLTDQPTVRNCAATAGPNIPATEPPPGPRDEWGSVPAKNAPASQPNRQFAANAQPVLRVAAPNRHRYP